MICRPENLRENNATIPVSLFKASAMLSAHNLQIERMAAARLRAVCKTLEVDRGRQNRPRYRAADGRACIGEAGSRTGSSSTRSCAPTSRRSRRSRGR
jgi:hypothetical protein